MILLLILALCVCFSENYETRCIVDLYDLADDLVGDLVDDLVAHLQCLLL